MFETCEMIGTILGFIIGIAIILVVLALPVWGLTWIIKRIIRTIKG